MSEKHQECSECGKPLAHRVHSPTYGTHAYREPVASPQATEPPINLSPVAEYWAEYHNRPIEEADTDELLFAHNWAQRGIGREDAGSPAERQQPSKLHNEGSSPSSPSNSNINIALHRAAQPAAGTTPQAERSGGPLCDNCGKAVKQHYCWADSNPCGVSTYHPSEARAVAPVETPEVELQTLLDAGFNGFAVQLLAEELTRKKDFDTWKTPIKFTFRGVRFTLEKVL